MGQTRYHDHRKTENNFNNQVQSLKFKLLIFMHTSNEIIFFGVSTPFPRMEPEAMRRPRSRTQAMNNYY